MEQYTVTGMSCAACQARVEKAVSKVPGVESCSVSLLTNTMGVEGTASPAEVMKAVEDAGYGASPKGAGAAGGAGRQAGSLTAKLAAEEEALKDHETPVLKKRLIASLGFLLVLMYFSMGHNMFGFPLPAFFDGNPVAVGIVQMLLAGIVMVINQKFFISGFKSLFHGAPNMDTLIAMGSGAAFTYSTVMLLAMSRAAADGNMEAAMKYMMEFYFESAAMILTLITVGKMLEARSKGKTTDALKSLMKLAPKTANVERGGVEETIDIDLVQKGDIPGLLRDDQPVRIPPLSGDQGRRRHQPVPGHSDGQRRGVHQGTHCQNSGYHLGRLCPGGHRYSGPRHADLALHCESARRNSAGQRHLRPGSQLPLCTGACDARGHHGGQRNGRQERDPL